MKAAKQLTTCLALAALCACLLVPAAAQADFGLGEAGAVAKNADGTVDFQAGSHPFEYTVSFKMNEKALLVPDGKLRDIVVDLPAGLVGNQQALPRCSGAAFEGQSATCPGDTQIGIAEVGLPAFLAENTRVVIPLFNMTPPKGVAGRIGFSLVGFNSFQDATVRSAGDYGLTISDLGVPDVELIDFKERIWGVPGASGHDAERQCLAGAGEEHFIFGCASEAPPVPFLTLPTSCSEPLETSIGVDSVENPGVFDTKTVLSEEEGTPAGMDGCNHLEFAPTISAQPTTSLSDAPTGLDFKLHVPQPPAVQQGAGRIDTCSAGSWEGKPTAFAYRWLRNGTEIPGAHEPTYEVQEADTGALLQCEVTATNAAIGPARSASTPLQVPPGPATPAPTPTVPRIKVSLGSPETTYTCEPGAWGGKPTFSYQWFKNGTALGGQTEATITLTQAEAPYALQCEAIGSNPTATVIAYSKTANSSSPVLKPELPSPNSPPGLTLDESELPLSSAHLKDTTVTLPAGLVVNPSAANGLGTCSEGEIGYAPSGGKIHFSTAPQSCPAASKLGTVEVNTPLLGHKLGGAVYLAQPYANPFGSFLAIYLAVEDEETGINAKLAGKITPDPNTGQLTAHFEENPQLPLEDVELHFFNGPKAALKTPLACGAHTTTSTLVPWSTPEGATVHPSDTFQTSVPAGGSGSCPASEAQAPNAPSFTAGTIAPQAAAYTPFVLKLVRQDGTQRLKQIDTTLPKGLTGKLAGIPYCPEAAIAQAISREAPNQGALEQAHPSCPAASEIGTATVGAGAGITPYYTTAHAYLAGPYKGAPLSMAIIAPAVAGPFDLGAVVVRTPFYVNSETAQIHAVSDPLPQIIQGVPLDIRSIALKLDRPSFTLNPTSCDPMQVLGSSTSALGSPASLESPFQVGGCKALKFSPKLAISLKGGTKRGRFPALKAVLTYPQGPNYANTASAQVTLPHGEFLENAHFKTICTNVQFKANACPPGSIYGKARAFTPLLDKPVEGPVYLRSSTHELPDLVISLQGQVDADLVGRVDTGKHKGLRTTFESAPDVPVSKVVLEMQGGKKGLLVNSENICSTEQRAIADLTAQNGKVSETNPLVRNDCKGKAKKKHKKTHKGGKANGGKH